MMEIKEEIDGINCVFIEEDYSERDQFDPLSSVIKEEDDYEEVDVKPDLPPWCQDSQGSSSYIDPPPPDDYMYNNPSPSSQEDTKEEMKFFLNDKEAVAGNSAQNRDYKCSECGKEFAAAYRLKRHLEGHTKKCGQVPKELKKKICTICGKCFKTNQKLNRHLLIHAKDNETVEQDGSIERNHKCPKCGKGFPYPSTLKRHIATHDENDDTQMKLFQCKQCLRYFTSQLKLEVHEQLHTDAALVCNICSKAFTKKYYLEAHLLRHKDEGKFLCDECGRKFNSDHNLRTHIFRMHNPRSREVSGVLCNLCGKSFFDQKAFERHEIVHTDVRSVPCPQCPMMFKTVQNRNIHMTIHTGQKPHACDICGKAFRRISWLKTHMAVHGNDRKDCPYCKTCTKSIYIRKHIVTKHRGLPIQITDGPMACTICKQVFETLKELKIHVKIHSTEPIAEATDAATEVSENPAGQD